MNAGPPIQENPCQCVSNSFFVDPEFCGKYFYTLLPRIWQSQRSIRKVLGGKSWYTESFPFSDFAACKQCWNMWNEILWWFTGRVHQNVALAWKCIFVHKRGSGQVYAGGSSRAHRHRLGRRNGAPRLSILDPKQATNKFNADIFLQLILHSSRVHNASYWLIRNS